MKEVAIQLIKDLPDDVDLVGIIEALYIRYRVEKRLEEIDDGEVISHEDLKKEFSSI